MINKVKMIVGLGNLGKKYTNTRHNAGQLFIIKLANQASENFNLNSKLNSYIAKINISHSNIILMFPTTYMNNSGLAVNKVASFYKIISQEILVVHDELDIGYGQIRLKKGGGHGGHNGLRSINENLGTNDYLRLRIGIDHPGDKSKVANYVLSEPTIEQKKQIEVSIDDAIYFLDDIINYRLESVMQRLHIK